MWGMSIFDPRYVPAPDGTLFLRRKPLPQSGDHQMGLAFALRQTRDRLPEAEILSSERGQGGEEEECPLRF